MASPNSVKGVVDSTIAANLQKVFIPAGSLSRALSIHDRVQTESVLCFVVAQGWLLVLCFVVGWLLAAEFTCFVVGSLLPNDSNQVFARVKLFMNASRLYVHINLCFVLWSPGWLLAADLNKHLTQTW